MKADTLVILGAAAAGLWLVARMTRTTGAVVRPGGTASSLNNGGNLPTTEIQNSAMPGDSAWGWRYYTDGTAIGPDGAYYYQGQRIWSPA